MNITEKIIASHLVSGKMQAGEEISLRIDQTLTQDATGTMAYLQFEAMGVPKVRTKLSVSYVDHNTLQNGFENADDHSFLRSIAAKYGIVFSPAGNGICHQIHLERFGVPGATLIGSDSHTPTGGGLGMLAFGAGGLDVACAMAGEPFYITMPRVVKVTLNGKLRPWVSAKDIILELLRRLTVKGGRGKVFEFSGPGVKTLSVPERATITNMGTELGATTSVFPSDGVTKQFLAAEGRAKDWKEFIAEEDSQYDEEVIIELNTLEPMIALPHSPDNVKKVSEVTGTAVQQVAIGSCTNSSLKDMLMIAKVLKGKKVNPDTSVVISPGSRQVTGMLTDSGALKDIIMSGARLLECACGPCIGVGQAPSSGAVSLRTFNRNFEGRSGTKDAKVYLCSPETAVAAALSGKITDPRRYFKAYPKIALPKKFFVDDKLFLKPAKNPSKVSIIRGPNIKPLPEFPPMEQDFKAETLIRLGDNISTDHILPAGSKILPLRSNLPAISEFTFGAVDKDFAKRAKAAGSGVIVGGDNYGQGSSREHAALAPKYLGVRAVIVKTFARIHLANLINFGIIPLTFKDPAGYDLAAQGTVIEFKDIIKALKSNSRELKVLVTDKAGIVLGGLALEYNLTQRQKDVLLAGGLLNFIKKAKR